MFFLREWRTAPAGEPVGAPEFPMRQERPREKVAWAENQALRTSTLRSVQFRIAQLHTAKLHSLRRSGPAFRAGRSEFTRVLHFIFRNSPSGPGSRGEGPRARGRLTENKALTRTCGFGQKMLHVGQFGQKRVFLPVVSVTCSASRAGKAPFWFMSGGGPFGKRTTVGRLLSF